MRLIFVIPYSEARAQLGISGYYLVIHVLFEIPDTKEQTRVNGVRDAKSLKSRYKELDEGNEIRDAKGKNKEGDSSPSPLFVTRILKLLL